MKEIQKRAKYLSNLATKYYKVVDGEALYSDVMLKKLIGDFNDDSDESPFKEQPQETLQVRREIFT